MTTPIGSIVLSFAVPALLLVLLLAAAARKAGLRPRGAGWCFGLAVVSLGILFVPVAGLPLARCLAGIADHWSVPLLALLASAVAKQLHGLELLRLRDLLVARWFGLVAGLFLYPMALGWGPFDPYCLGWRFGPLFAVMGLFAAVLLWRRNRFGIVLVLAILAWHLGVTESGNYWDCVLDPFYFLVSAGMIAALIKRGAGTSPPAQTNAREALVQRSPTR